MSALELKLGPFNVRNGGCFFQLDLSLEPAFSTDVCVFWGPLLLR